MPRSRVNEWPRGCEALDARREFPNSEVSGSTELEDPLGQLVQPLNGSS
jgi:hypothetical protein